MNPVHLLFINLITDCFPALALGLEREEPDVMERPPRPLMTAFSPVVWAGTSLSGHPHYRYHIGLLHHTGHCMEVGYFEMPKASPTTA